MVYGVPPAILGMTDKSSFASTEALMQFWLARGLGFAINHIEVGVRPFLRPARHGRTSTWSSIPARCCGSPTRTASRRWRGASRAASTRPTRRAGPRSCRRRRVRRRAARPAAGGAAVGLGQGAAGNAAAGCAAGTAAGSGSRSGRRRGARLDGADVAKAGAMSNRQLEQIVDGIAAASQAERAAQPRRSRSRHRGRSPGDKAELQLETERALAEVQERRIGADATASPANRRLPGEQGPAGEPGTAGRDRASRANPAQPGERGEKGDQGEPGEPAPDPTEDMVAAALEKVREDRLEIDEKLFAATRRFDRLSAELEERLASLKDGEPGPAGPASRDRKAATAAMAAPARRAAYTTRRETYRKLDRVSFNGSEWIARKDDPGPLPGDGWMLGAQGKTGQARRRHPAHRDEGLCAGAGDDRRQGDDHRPARHVRALRRGARRMSYTVTSVDHDDAAGGHAADDQEASARRCRRGR